MNQNAVCAPAAGSRNTQKKRFTLKMRTREALTGYLFISVNLIGTLIFVVLPLFMTVVLSFSEWDYTKGLAGMEFVGLEHYARMVSDPKISTSLWNNLYFSFLQIPVTIVLALLLASLLNKIAFCKKFLRTVYFIPFILLGFPYPSYSKRCSIQKAAP